MSKLSPFSGALTVALSGLVATLLLCLQAEPSAQQPARLGPASPSTPSNHRQLVDKYCTSCHNDRLKTGGLSLDQVDPSKPAGAAEVWEKVVRKLNTGTMPPPNMPQPSQDDRRALMTWLTTELDAASAARPDPGRTETLRRLNRTEYQNAIRDLLALDIDAASLLPADESGHGFDNVTVGDLPPTLLDRYISAAQKISRLAIGTTQTALLGDIIRLPPDLTQEDQLPGLPIGTRGGVSVPHTFVRDGEYDIQVTLERDLNDSVSGLREARPHELLLLVDREPVATFSIMKPADGDDTRLDKDLKKRVPVTAGPHEIAVTFVKDGSALAETARQPTLAHINDRHHPRTTPAISQLSVTGPYGAKGAENTPSRRRLFVCQPSSTAPNQDVCARTIISTLMRRAYRRPISKEEVEGPMAFYREGRGSGGDFDAGIGNALSAILINPEFLFRVETDPKKVPAGGVYRISDLELASRLSFFLWSSIPDDELLNAATSGTLSRPDVLEKQTRRMLADHRSFNLATNFAGQWLRLRNLDAVSPTARLFPDFDDNLRQAFRQETELFIDSVVREDRSILDFIRTNYTFLNERLAKHYGIPDVYGSRFRRVTLAPESRRGGLLRQGSVLTVTSYATRTSPVIRGVYVLNNIFGAPPPPPLPNVPALDESTVSANLSMRERLAAHRKNPVCANCHRTIDPVGFAMESFNAVGQWRDLEPDGQPVDVSGSHPGVGEFKGVAGLEEALLKRPELFTASLTEKLMTFALGRGVEYYDAPSVRKIARDVAKNDYRFSSVILGIVKSAPFQMRRAEAGSGEATARNDRAPAAAAR
jgi:mono/diheme cytochrome c family protein